jgi:hypothetical protein
MNPHLGYRRSARLMILLRACKSACAMPCTEQRSRDEVAQIRTIQPFLSTRGSGPGMMTVLQRERSALKRWLWTGMRCLWMQGNCCSTVILPN